MNEVEVTRVQRVLHRGLHPLLSTLPLCFFGGAVLVDLGALVSGFHLFGQIAYWVVTAALLVGLITSTALLVDFTTSPVGSVAHRVRGVASAAITGVVVAFTLAWYVRGDSPSGGVVLLETVSFLAGLLGMAVAKVPESSRQPGLFEVSADQAWPFTTTTT
jgi:uncharacterized membrane protein